VTVSVGAWSQFLGV